jgi:hypothetical protein
VGEDVSVVSICKADGSEERPLGSLRWGIES